MSGTRSEHQHATPNDIYSYLSEEQYDEDIRSQIEYLLSCTEQSPLVIDAIDLAFEIHKHQTRKGKNIPYMTHCVGVAVILTQVTRDENIIAAGLLHDTVEDCEPYGSLTVKHIKDRFNDTVARIVFDLTEQDRTLLWKVRKEISLQHIPAMQHDSLLVKSADVIHNITDLVDDLQKYGASVFAHFHASRDQIIERSVNVVQAIKNTWSDNPLLPQLTHMLESLLEWNNAANSMDLYQ